jgi:hypothetical protein
MPSATNVGIYNLGSAPGDHIIPGGYVKASEECWLDSYTIAFTSTKTTLDIAVIPANRKLTSVDVVIETSISQTSGCLALGFSSDAAYGSVMEQSSIAHNFTLSTLSLFSRQNALYSNTLTGWIMKLNAFQKVISGTQNTLTLQFNNWTMTTGTVKSIVRYT